MKRKVLLITFLALLGPGALADVYKWVDKDGKVHYGDKPPQHVEGERVPLRPANAPSRSEDELRDQLEQLGREAEHRVERQRARAAAERVEREERLAQEETCLEARNRLAVLQEQLPVYRDEDGKFRAKWLRDTYRGERDYLDDAARASEIERARQAIGTTCRRSNDSEEQDRVRRQWRVSQRCAAIRADLEALERPQARASRQTLEEKRRLIATYCQQ